MTATLVLYFGEDVNDTLSLIELTKALVPATTSVKHQHIRKPPILRRDAALKKRRDMSQEIAGFAKPFARRGRVACVVHRDCDAVEPAHVKDAAELEADLKASGVPRPVAATPAWEMEAWWMLFPSALRAVRGCWTVVNYSNASVGMIQNAKERLRRDLRPKDVKCRDYAESDSIAIAREITKQQLATQAICAQSASLDDYRSRLCTALTS